MWSNSSIGCWSDLLTSEGNSTWISTFLAHSSWYSWQSGCQIQDIFRLVFFQTQVQPDFIEHGWFTLPKTRSSREGQFFFWFLKASWSHIMWPKRVSLRSWGEGQQPAVRQLSNGPHKNSIGFMGGHILLSSPRLILPSLRRSEPTQYLWLGPVAPGRTPQWHPERVEQGGSLLRKVPNIKWGIWFERSKANVTTVIVL